jgi:hypothetical protein
MGSGPIMTPMIAQFLMPQFPLSDDPETWFNCAQQIFTTHRINTEQEKFGYLIQSLSHRDLTHLKHIINDTVNLADKYSRAKARLIELHAQTEDDKIRALLQGANISSNQKPTFILHEIKQLAPQAHESIHRGVWEQILPKDIKEHIAPWANKPLTEQAEVPDLVYKARQAQDQPSAINIAPTQIAEVSDNSTDSRFDSIFNTLHQMQMQIAELSTKRSRSRECSQSSNRTCRSPSYSPNRRHNSRQQFWRNSPAP